jgi:hypothetical protein
LRPAKLKTTGLGGAAQEVETLPWYVQDPGFKTQSRQLKTGLTSAIKVTPGLGSTQGSRKGPTVSPSFSWPQVSLVVTLLHLCLRFTQPAVALLSLTSMLVTGSKAPQEIHGDHISSLICKEPFFQIPSMRPRNQHTAVFGGHHSITSARPLGRHYVLSSAVPYPAPGPSRIPTETVRPPRHRV